MSVSPAHQLTITCAMVLVSLTLNGTTIAQAVSPTFKASFPTISNESLRNSDMDRSNTAAGDAKLGYDIAMAIAELAKINGEVDIQYLGHYLKLPNLQRDLTWQGPPSESEASNISAVYTPPNSELGIAKVLLSRRTGGTVMLDGKPAEFHSLSLFLKLGACPGESTLTDAIGYKATKARMPGYDGGPSYETTTFFVPQSHGGPVQITFVGENTCNVTISHYRPL